MFRNVPGCSMFHVLSTAFGDVARFVSVALSHTLNLPNSQTVSTANAWKIKAKRSGTSEQTSEKQSPHSSEAHKEVSVCTWCSHSDYWDREILSCHISYLLYSSWFFSKFSTILLSHRTSTFTSRSCFAIITVTSDRHDSIPMLL